MSKFSKITLLLLTTFALNSAAPTPGEIATAEALLSYRVARKTVWLDPLNNESLHRRKPDGELVVAAKDDDVHANLDNAGTIMGGYLCNPNTAPAATTRPQALATLIADANWKRLFVVVEKYRKSTGNIMHDCFGRAIYRAALGATTTVGNTRDIVDIPTLLAVVDPVIVAGQAVVQAERPAITAGERASAEALLTFRRSKDFLWLDPRTSQPLYRMDGDNTIKAALDDDIHASLDNVGTIMGGYLANAPAVAASSIPDTLKAIFADANLTRLYTKVETARRGQNRFVIDCLGNPLYKLALGAREQAVDMRDVVDTQTLLTAVEYYFPEDCRTAVARAAGVV